MLKFFILIIPFLIFGCASKRSFPAKKVCFMLYNMQTKKLDEVFNDVRCHERLPAGSTFKVPLSVIAFDTGLLKSEKLPEFKWKGEKTIFEPWNKDQTPVSWMRDSVVWVSQELTYKLGDKKITKYLQDFDFGNADMSGGIKYAWLTPAPFIYEPMQNTLRVSGYDQVKFLEKLWHGELKASKDAQEQTIKLLTQDTSPRGFVLTGKTGSGFTDENYDHRLGWYVGHLKKGQAEYIVVVNFTDKRKQKEVSYGGREAKELAMKLLGENGLW